jgi:hypothetical protein
VLPRDAARASIGRRAVCLYYWALAPAGLAGALAELDAAPALEMPANVPPVVSAPATIVAPSSFDVFMRSNLHLWGWVVVSIDRPLRG